MSPPRSSPLLVPVLPLLAALAGCAPSVHLAQPDAALPVAFEAADHPEAHESASLDRWWDDFNDPQLADLVTTALKRSTTARLAYARIVEARASRAQARATTLPSGSLSASATEQGTVALGGASATSGGYQTYDASLGASWELDLFGRLSAIRSRADSDAAVATYDFYGTRLALAADVADGLFQARALAVQRVDAEEARRIAADLARTGELGAERGLTAPQDVARLRADLAASEAEVERVTAELRVARRNLLILVGTPAAATDSLPIEARLAAPPALPAVTPGILLARRPDVLSAEWTLRSATSTLRIDRLALFPRLSLQPGLGLTATANGNPAAGILSGATGFWSIAAGLTLPILDRTRLIAAMRISEARGAQAVIGYERAVQTAFGESENALTRLAADQRRTSDLDRAAQNAGLAFEAARKGRVAGLTDLTTLLQVEQVWRQNRVAASAAHAAWLTDTVTAIRALGGGWSPAAVGQAEHPQFPEPGTP